MCTGVQLQLDIVMLKFVFNYLGMLFRQHTGSSQYWDTTCNVINSVAVDTKAETSRNPGGLSQLEIFIFKSNPSKNLAIYENHSQLFL